MPSVRSVFLISISAACGVPSFNALANFFIRTFSSIVSESLKSYGFFFVYSTLSFAKPLLRIFLRSSSVSTSFVFKRSILPTSSSTVLTPSFDIYSLSSSATNIIKFTMYSLLPLKRFLSSGFCVATPNGQVSRLHTRIIAQPKVTSGAVAKPYSSAPKIAAIATSRPVISLPSVSITTLFLSPFIISVRCASASPNSHGSPALYMELLGAAPVPPS